MTIAVAIVVVGLLALVAVRVGLRRGDSDGDHAGQDGTNGEPAAPPDWWGRL